MTDTFIPEVGGKVRILDTEFARAIGLPIGELVTVTKIPQSLESTTTVRIDTGDLLINDSLDTEFEVVSD